MPELRKDPIVGRWVIIAENRARRPIELAVARRVETAGTLCPFCEGNEAHTPGEIAAYRAAGTARDTPGWRVRVVPNKYPALEIEGELSRREPGLYDTIAGIGAHEVIIESPTHTTSTVELPVAHMAEVISIYLDRLNDLKQDRRLVYGMLFKNVGASAGASLEHTHSQLIVMPIVPISVSEELDGSHRYFRERGRCIFCDLVEQELALGERLVCDSAGFVAFSPFAARFPFETWIVPRRHASHFETLPRGDTLELAGLLQRVLEKIEAALDHPAYNYIIHTAPFDTPSLDHYHWHIEIIPRVTSTAGFEWGSGFYINPVPPEQAAAMLRKLGS